MAQTGRPPLLVCASAPPAHPDNRPAANAGTPPKRTEPRKPPQTKRATAPIPHAGN